MAEIGEVVQQHGHKDTVYQFNCAKCDKKIYRKHLMDRICDGCYQTTGEELVFESENVMPNVNIPEESLLKEIDQAVKDCNTPKRGPAELKVQITVNGKSFPVHIELYNLMMLILSNTTSADHAKKQIQKYHRCLGDVINFINTL